MSRARRVGRHERGGARSKRTVVMTRIRHLLLIVAVGLGFSRLAMLADGMVVPEVSYPVVAIPDQQALIHHADGVERLVIETSFRGAGTNFAWVVPLPSPPQVKPLPEHFFTSLQRAFQPRLTYRVAPYYAGILLVCALGFLGCKCLRADAVRPGDFALCLLIAFVAGVMGRHVAFGVLGLLMALCLRFLASAPTTFALLLLIGTGFSTGLTLLPGTYGLFFFTTMGGEASDPDRAGSVEVVSVQRAGLFDVTTIRGTTTDGVLQWLESNGYQPHHSAGAAIDDYVRQGWVFVAAKARRRPAEPQTSTLHPLGFTFATPAPVYPTRLTAVGNERCLMHLYVFGNQRATARHFTVVRCDRLEARPSVAPAQVKPGLRIEDPDALEWIGRSTVGTKLSGTLSAGQMRDDVWIKPRFYWKSGAHVYSPTGAAQVALNVALPLALLAWTLIGSSRGGWGADDRWVTQWRWRWCGIALAAGVAVFLILPKVDVL